MVKNPPCNAADTCRIPGRGTKIWHVPLQCSCLENPRDGEAWWAAVYGVAQSRTRLKQLSSSSRASKPQAQLLGLSTATRESQNCNERSHMTQCAATTVAHVLRACASQQEKPPTLQKNEAPAHSQLEKVCTQQRRARLTTTKKFFKSKWNLIKPQIKIEASRKYSSEQKTMLKVTISIQSAKFRREILKDKKPISLTNYKENKEKRIQRLKENWKTLGLLQWFSS